jgi:hypothetical protein
MLPFIKTAALVVILFLIMALLSRMSASEVPLGPVEVQRSVRTLIQKSQDAALRVTTSAHPVHNLVNTTQALDYLESVLTLTDPKTCEELTGCKVNDVIAGLTQQQETAAASLYYKPVQHHRLP